mgnify:CR=1 FL=1
MRPRLLVVVVEEGASTSSQSPQFSSLPVMGLIVGVEEEVEEGSSDFGDDFLVNLYKSLAQQLPIFLYAFLLNLWRCCIVVV